MSTGTNGRVAADVLGCSGIFIGVDRAARETPISTASTSICASELLQCCGLRNYETDKTREMFDHTRLVYCKS